MWWCYIIYMIYIWYQILPLTDQWKTAILNEYYVACAPDPTESTPSVMDSFQSSEVQVGHSVELPCIASGFPNPTIRWLKDGRPLPADSRWTRRLTGLTISDLRMEDSGNYICEVTNSFGSKEVTGYLNVIGEGINIWKVRGDFAQFCKCLLN